MFRDLPDEMTLTPLGNGPHSALFIPSRACVVSGVGEKGRKTKQEQKMLLFFSSSLRNITGARTSRFLRGSCCTWEDVLLPGNLYQHDFLKCKSSDIWGSWGLISPFGLMLSLISSIWKSGRFLKANSGF